MTYTYKELIQKIVDNLGRLGYDDLASVHNDILGMDGALGHKVNTDWPDEGAEEPVFTEEDS